MTATAVAPTTAIALLAGLHPATGELDRVHAVLAWTDIGDRHYERLPVPISRSVCNELVGPSRPDPTAAGHAVQLQLDISGPAPLAASSMGRTWQTWSLPSIPASMRHLDLGAVARALATQLSWDSA